MKESLANYLTLQPWQHQQDAFDFLSNRQYGALFMEMGCGKTAVQIGLIGAFEPGHWLIVCPLAMVEVWAREIRKFARYDVEVVPLAGPIKNRTEELHRGDRKNKAIFITNYESLIQDNFWTTILRHQWLGLVLDESHRIKSPSSQTTKKLTNLGKTVKYRFILTGTPAADKPIDIFAQYRFLDQNIFGNYFNSFRDRYTIGTEKVNTKSGGRYYEILGYRNQEELSQRIYQHAFRVTGEILDLPPTTDTEIPIELGSKARIAYRRMLKDSIVEFENDEFTSAANVLSRLLRLQQITSGFLQPESLPGEPKKPIQLLGDEKKKALVDLLQDIGSEPVVVFYRFSHDATSISEACVKAGRPYFELSGRVNNLDEWKQAADPNRVLAVQIKAGGSGVSTTEASKVIYFSNSYSLTDWQQSRARSHRPGQKRPVSYYSLIAKDTIDEVIAEALSNKETTVKALIDGLRRQV